MLNKQKMARLALELGTIEDDDNYPITFANIWPALGEKRLVFDFLVNRFIEEKDYIAFPGHISLTKNCAISLLSLYAIEKGRYDLLASIVLTSQGLKVKLAALVMTAAFSLYTFVPMLPQFTKTICQPSQVQTK